MKTAYRIIVLSLALVFVIASGESAAQSFPNKPIRFVTGNQAGGGTDTLARIVGPRLGERVGQPVIVENRAGADGAIASEFVAKSAPDGYTLLVGTDGQMVLNVGLYAKLPYDPVADFVPVILFSSQPLVFAVHPSFSATSIKELIELAKAKPGELFYASGAPVFRVATELFKAQTGINIVHVPYKGPAPALNAVIAGEVPLATLPQGSALAQIRAGKLRALAITSPRRSALIPDVPTMAESGVANFEVGPWTGLFAPAGTPSATIDRLNSELSVVLKRDDVQARFGSMGLNISGMPSAELAVLLKADLAKWRNLMRGLTIRAE